MKVKFFNLEKVNLNEGLLKGTVEFKGEESGIAILKKGKLYLKIKDENLRKILTQPFPVTVKKKDAGGALCHKTVTSHPGTKDHLAAIAYGCWQFGYMAEVSE
jgi:hypothetical protein